MELNPFMKNVQIPPDGRILHSSNEQWIIRFENGYGASIISNAFSGFIPEIAVIHFDHADLIDWRIDYDNDLQLGSYDLISTLCAEKMASILQGITAFKTKAFIKELNDKLWENAPRIVID